MNILIINRVLKLFIIKIDINKMKTFIFSLFFISILFSSHAQNSSDIIVLQGSTVQKILDEGDPIYFIGNSTSSSNICTIDEPTYAFNYYSQSFEQIDPVAYINQTLVFGIDQMVYVLLNNGTFQAFNISFNDDQTTTLTHLSDISSWNYDLVDELQGNQYVGLLYEEAIHNLLIVTKNIAIFINVNFDNKIYWLETSLFNFQNLTTSPAEILYAKSLNGNVYILRNNNIFEVWKIFSNATTGFYLVQKNSVNLTLEFLSDFQTLGANVIDFEINNEFFSFLEKNSMSLYLINYTIAGFVNLQSQLVKKLSYVVQPFRIELTTDFLFVLINNNNANSTLLKYELSPNLPFSTTFKLLGGFTDFYVGDDFFIASYPLYAQLTPHSFQSPSNVNSQLTMQINVQGLNYVEPFIITKMPKFIPFKIFKDSTFQFMKIDFQPPVLICDLTNTNVGIYDQNYVFYRLPCIEVNFQCDRSLFYPELTNFNITVLSNGKVAPGQEDDTKGLTITVIILSIAVGVVLLLLIAGVVYLCRLLGIGKPPQGSLPPGKYAERVMSREELQMVGLNPVDQKKTETEEVIVVSSEQLKGPL